MLKIFEGGLLEAEKNSIYLLPIKLNCKSAKIRRGVKGKSGEPSVPAFLGKDLLLLGSQRHHGLFWWKMLHFHALGNATFKG